MAKREYRVERIGSEALCFVPLGPFGNQGEAIIAKRDLDNLIAAGVNPNWNFASNSVRTGTHLGVARILTGASSGQKVKYIDGNPLNLRRENLELVPGWSVKTDELYV